MKTHPTEESKPESTPFKDDSDICEQLMSRYSTSKALHHRHLIATAAAIRSLLPSDNLHNPTPAAYFVASIDNLSNFEILDSTAIAALLSFVSILVPLIGEKEMKSDVASEGVRVLVAVVERKGVELGAGNVSSVVKCLGVLIVKFCDLDNWKALKLGFETVLNLCVDKRPKVRKGAQDCLEKFFKSFGSCNVINKSSKLVLSVLQSYKSSAVTLSELNVLDGSKDDTLSKHGNLEVLHILNLVRLLVPYLSVKISSKVLSELLELIRPQFSPLTRHVLTSIEAFFETSKEEVINGPYSEECINYLCEYICVGEENPADTVISAANLLKIWLGKLHTGDLSSWLKIVPKLFGSVAGLLTCETTIASQASEIIKQIISLFMDQIELFDESQSFEDVSKESEEAHMMQLICAILEKTLSSCNGVPSEHLLEVVSALFLKLRGASFVFMKNLVLKLTNMMNSIGSDKSDINHLQSCLGSAVVAMGPERMLALIPISVNADHFSCSNVWFISILKKHVVGASLEYYLEHIVPLAKAFKKASKKAKKSVIGQDLEAHAHALWGLLPAFCRYPVDTHRMFGSLAELLATFLKEDPLMHENVAVALQTLVKENRSTVISRNTSSESHDNAMEDAFLRFNSVPIYSKKTASRNIKALSSYSAKLLQALVDLFVDSQPEKRLYIKDTVGCLASITESSIIKNILMSVLEKFQLVNDGDELELPVDHRDGLIETAQESLNTIEKDAKRCVIMELESSLIEGANEDLISLIYNHVVCILKDITVMSHCEAYHTLSKILEEHAWFFSSRFKELIDILTGLKPPSDVDSLRNRFACFHILMIHTLKICSEDENTKAFLMLNEIIVTLKDVKDEARKVAYDALLRISSHFRNLSSTDSAEPYHKLISMIMGYLSGPSPHIKSGAVSALSLLVYNDVNICGEMPELVSSLLFLLQHKSVEVIKAVLGFVKVLVSSLQAKDLQNLLSDIINSILLWSTVSRFHFRSKVTVILEIMIRKCGSAAVESVTPDKYRDFIKTVLQNRHHRSTTKEGSTDVEIKLGDLSRKSLLLPRTDKRKHKESGFASEEKGSLHQKKRRENKENESPLKSADPYILREDGGGFEEAKGHQRSSKYGKSMKGWSAGSGKRRKPVKEPTTTGKKRVERRYRMVGETAFRKPTSSSNFCKHKKHGKKQKG